MAIESAEELRAAYEQLGLTVSPIALEAFGHILGCSLCSSGRSGKCQVHRSRSDGKNKAIGAELFEIQKRLAFMLQSEN